MRLPSKSGLYWAFVGDPKDSTKSEPNAIVEVFEKATYLRTQILTISNCDRPLLHDDRSVDSSDKHITIGCRIQKK